MHAVQNRPGPYLRFYLKNKIFIILIATAATSNNTIAALFLALFSIFISLYKMSYLFFVSKYIVFNSNTSFKY